MLAAVTKSTRTSTPKCVSAGVRSTLNHPLDLDEAIVPGHQVKRARLAESREIPPSDNEILDDKSQLVAEWRTRR